MEDSTSSTSSTNNPAACENQSQYANYHPDDLAVIDQFPELILAASPSEFRTIANEIFLFKGLRALQDSEFPDMPLGTGSAPFGWALQWIRDNPLRGLLYEYIKPIYKGEQTVASWVGHSSETTTVKKIHSYLAASSNPGNSGPSNASSPRTTINTTGKYDDPASPEPISIEPSMSISLQEYLAFKNSHRALLESPRYREEYIASNGIICHCCGDVNRAAANWPQGGSKLRVAHAGIDPWLCPACRNAIYAVFHKTGIYSSIPDKLKSWIDNKLVAMGGSLVMSLLPPADRFMIVAVINKVRDKMAAQIAETKAATTVATVESLLDSTNSMFD